MTTAARVTCGDWRWEVPYAPAWGAQSREDPIGPGRGGRPFGVPLPNVLRDKVELHGERPVGLTTNALEWLLLSRVMLARAICPAGGRWPLEAE